MSSPRVRRIADRIKVVVAQMLEHRMKDPRLGFVTVTEVRVSGDTQHATVFYTVMGEQTSIDQTAAALTSATGLLRSAVGRELGMRHTPTLEFVLDAVPENARQIEDLLSKARESDAQVAARAASASYAGDANPYRVSPRDVTVRPHDSAELDDGAELDNPEPLGDGGERDDRAEHKDGGG